jgi:two-component system response regulator MprA
LATILVADDDQLLRAIIRDHLERADHTVLEAGDGIAAIDIALDERPEVLLLDVMMPLARGLEVARRVRLQEGWHPSIVMISVRTRVSDRLNALEAGADAYVEKPFSPEALLEIVEHQLTDAAPARFVDVLGPVWAALAVERLTADALERRTHVPAGAEQVEAVFTDLVARSLGRIATPDDPTCAPVDAMRLLWEDAIRALLRDTADPEVPVAGDVGTPDALAAVERLIGREVLHRHRARLGGAPPVDLFWSAVLDEALVGPRPAADRAAPKDATDEMWARRLRAVLGPDPEADGLKRRWSAVLGGVLGAGDQAEGGIPTIDPLGPVWLALAGRGATAERAR